MDQNSDDSEKITILGQEPKNFVKYVYFILMALTAITLIYSLIPHGVENHDYEMAAKNLEQVQLKIAQADEMTQEMQEELDRAREMVVAGSFKHQGVSLSIGLLTGLIGFATFCSCVFTYFQRAEELGDYLHMHIKYLLILQLGYFVVGLILSLIFASVWILFVLVSIGLLGSELYLMVCGYKLFEKEEDITKETLIAQAKALKTEIQTKVQSRMKKA